MKESSETLGVLARAAIALLREAPEQWSVHRLAENGEEAHGGQAARH
jgi:hypothetical protein